MLLETSAVAWFLYLPTFLVQSTYERASEASRDDDVASHGNRPDWLRARCPGGKAHDVHFVRQEASSRFRAFLPFSL
jgi:hypothetical protein